MPRIPYVDPQAVSDPEIRGYLERARREGTPRPESQAIRGSQPERDPRLQPGLGAHLPPGSTGPHGQGAVPRWIKTLGIRHGEVFGDTTAGLKRAEEATR
jgi:hypothetical protein